MAATSHRSARKRFVLPLVFLSFVALGLWQRQFIHDQIKLYNYQPVAAISQLADDTTMTGDARRIFYVNHPELQPRSSFSNYCSAGAEKTAVLGCYKAPQNGIYVLQVANDELAGIQQVTAAHEMLHAAYDRLSQAERKRIDGLLQNYYDTGLKDKTIKATIDSYRKTEPDALVNEMHSIIGTESGKLPGELETYYKQYFADRSKIVGYYNTYERAFASRKAQITSYDQQLQQQKRSIDQLEPQVTAQAEALQTKRSQLDDLRSSDASRYNANVASYNQAADNYNSQVRRLKTAVDSYNRLVEQRNAVAFEEKGLVDAISAPDTVQMQ